MLDAALLLQLMNGPVEHPESPPLPPTIPGVTSAASIAVRTLSGAFGAVAVEGVRPADAADTATVATCASCSRSMVVCLRQPAPLDDGEAGDDASMIGPIKDPVGRTRDGGTLRYSEDRQIIDAGFVSPTSCAPSWATSISAGSTTSVPDCSRRSIPTTPIPSVPPRPPCCTRELP